MLDIMRRNSNSWLFVLVFGVITFVFAINFGPWVGNLGGEAKYAADVNGHVITFQDFQMAYASQIRMIQAVQPDFNPEGPVQEALKKTVLDRLIAKTLLAQLATQQNFTISDAELANFIRTQIFDKDKGLDRETYKRAIYSNYHMSESQFEAQLRQDLLAENMSKLIETEAPVNQYVEFLKKSAKIKT
jgi:peptidyl-prolyl cis-trans isomerase D